MQKSINLSGLPRYNMLVHETADEHISRVIMQHGVWEPFETGVARKIFENVDSFLNVGANIGWYVVLAGIVMRGKGQIYAFEPDPDNFQMLLDNVNANDIVNVTAEQMALSATVGNQVLFRSGTNRGDHRIYNVDADRSGPSVPITTIDEYFARIDMPLGFVMFDTQGAESLIFKGMKNYFDRFGPASIIITEFWPYGLKSSGSSAEDFLSIIEPLGYEIIEVHEYHGNLYPCSIEDLRLRLQSDLSEASRDQTNLLLITPEHPNYLGFKSQLRQRQKPAA